MPLASSHRCCGGLLSVHFLRFGSQFWSLVHFTHRWETLSYSVLSPHLQHLFGRQFRPSFAPCHSPPVFSHDAAWVVISQRHSFCCHFLFVGHLHVFSSSCHLPPASLHCVFWRVSCLVFLSVLCDVGAFPLSSSGALSFSVLPLSLLLIESLFSFCFLFFIFFLCHPC